MLRYSALVERTCILRPTVSERAEVGRDQELHRWAETLAGIAKTGLGFTASSFEAERYEEVLAVAANIKASADNADLDAETISDVEETQRRVLARWRNEVGNGIAGYATPKVAVGAIVGDENGRLLLIQRADSGVWLYPTGWADIGYSPAEVVIKEVREETGIRCEVVKPMGVIDGLRAGFSRIPLYSLLFLCRATGGKPTPHPAECLDAGWFGPDDLPSPLVGYERWGATAFAAISGKPTEPLFDQPRNPVWHQSDEH